MRPMENGGISMGYAESPWLEQVKTRTGNHNIFHKVVPVSCINFDRLTAHKRVPLKVTVYYLSPNLI